VGAQGVGVFDAEQVATQALGDSIYTNPLLLGFAWQRGRVPLSLAAIRRAMVLNGVQVANNQAAFEWGRHCAHDLSAVQALFKTVQVIEFVKKPRLAELVARRVVFLTDYQNAAYAQSYRALVTQVEQVESAWGKTSLSEAVARYLFKLMAYKDEYEVARLYSDGRFAKTVADRFEGDYQLHFHLAPPLLAKTNDQGELIKQKFGPITLTVFKLLARFKGLRGTPWDVFGHAKERRQERALIAQYRETVAELLVVLAAGPQAPGALERYQLALDIARIPEQIRGFGHVKARHLAAAQQNWKDWLAHLRAFSGSD
jgi:indolepyruvate ferredoxin oxidoreductase